MLSGIVAAFLGISSSANYTKDLFTDHFNMLDLILCTLAIFTVYANNIFFLFMKIINTSKNRVE